MSYNLLLEERITLARVFICIVVFVVYALQLYNETGLPENILLPTTYYNPYCC